MLPAGMDPRTPVIVGVGQIVHRSAEPGLPGPVELAAESLRRAGSDSGTGDRLLRDADLVAAVASATRGYPAFGALVADELGTTPKRTWQSAPFGGDGPQRLLNAVAQAIADGTSDIALLTGAEAVASANVAHKSGITPDWPQQGADAGPDHMFGSDAAPNSAMEDAAGLVAPIYMYPLMESAMRGKLGLSVAEHQQRIGELWSRFSAVAADNPYAWLPGQRSVSELITPTADNRRVSSPYLKLLVANLTVDQGAGLILCSAAAAAAAGVPQDQWVFPHGGATATDTWFVSERADIAASPAIAAAGQAAMEGAGIGIDEIGHVDLYSCFPIAVQVGATALGLPIDDPNRPLTVTGGLTFGGGPGNNYTNHSIATMVERLRADPGSYGLTTALGWYMTKHGVGVYSNRPPAQLFRSVEKDTVDASRATAPGYTGPAVVEAYTVPYRKTADGVEPEAVVISALNPDGARILVRTSDTETIAACTDGDPIGASADIAAADRITVHSERKSG